ncbi:MAG: glycosyltransferase [Candidatus Cloacimonetes bacterium]|nr:glycosyltransferase [Candidatus Cloacimonadota bacterium]
MKPFCSFICAVYNREAYLKECLDSILSQSNFDFELVIVDDGSTDNTQKIIAQLQDARIKLINTEHKGCWSAKNIGIKHARGEYICFIDSDDFLTPDFLQNGMEGIKQNPEFDYFYPTELRIIKENGQPTNKIWRYISYPEPQALIKLFWERQIGGIVHAGAFIKKAVFEIYGLYDDSFFNLSDTAFIISNAMKIKFCLLPNLKTYLNRQHSKQTNTNYYERFRTFSEILDEIILKYPTEYFLGFKLDKNSKDFYDVCVEKFMSLANETTYNQHYTQKAKKYIELLRKL